MIEGIFVLFQDTANMPPAKARALVNKCKSNILDLEEKFPNWRVLALPVQPPQETELKIVKLTEKGVIVLYVDVGSRSPVAAEALIDRIKDDHRWLKELDKTNIAKVIIPIRCSESDVIYLDLEENNVEKT